MALGVSVPAVAQTATGTGSIKIVRPLTVTKNEDLAFGTIIRGAGTVTIDADDKNKRTTGLGVVGTIVKAAKFTLAGEGAQTVSISVPGTFSMTNKTPSTTGSLLVTTSKSIGATETLGGVFGDDGTLVFYVGGSVTLAANTASGDYSGTFNVDANYN